MLLTGHDQYSMVAIIRECVRTGAAGARTRRCLGSSVDRGGAGGARALPEFGGSEKGRSLISAYNPSAILRLDRHLKID